jgi:hypothetical protein
VTRKKFAAEEKEEEEASDMDMEVNKGGRPRLMSQQQNQQKPKFHD